MAQDWKQIVEDARTEIELLEIQREDIDRRIARLKKVILATIPMIPDLEGIGGGLLRFEIETAGITDACRKVLQASGKWMSPLAVRDALGRNGLDLSSQKNAMASIHAVLKRLREKHEVRAQTGVDGGTVYKWRANPFRRRAFVGAARKSIANMTDEQLAALASPAKVVEGK
jgi:hypothetical protein